MADLFSVTAPLAIRFKDGRRQIMIERMPYRNGILFLQPFWTETGVETALRFVPGPVRGDGPWKVGDYVFNVLGCHGTNSELALAFDQWQSYLEQAGEDYPAPPLIAAIARRYGAATDEN